MLLIGHGTSLDGDEAKFNLVGPDLSATEWARSPQADARPPRVRQHDRRELSVSPQAGRPRPRRPDRDRFGGAAVRDRVSGILRRRRSTMPRPISTRTAASRCGRRSPTPAPGCSSGSSRRGSCRPSGRCSTTPAPASAARRRIPAPTARSRASRISQPDAALALPSRHRRWPCSSSGAPSSKRQLEELKARKESTPPDQYDAELEKLLVEIARVAAQIRAKS